MDSNRETFETWNKGAAAYQAKFMDLTLYNHTYDVFCAALAKPQAKVLDIGCGPGNITKYLLSKRPADTLFGIDIAPNMIALAQKNNPGASFAVMDMRQLGDLQTKFDGIVAGFCLPYLPHQDLHAFIAACHHLLQAHGCLYLSFVEGDPKASGFQVSSSGDRVYFHYYRLDALMEVLRTKHFESIKVFKLKYAQAAKPTEVHTILIAKKKELS